MKAITPRLTCDQEKAIQKVIRQNVSEQMAGIQMQLDLLWLNSVRKELHLGPKRLKRIYETYFRDRAEYIEFYESDGFDGTIEYASLIELRNAGCDVPEWYKKFGTARVEYTISKGTTRQLREAKERKRKNDKNH